MHVPSRYRESDPGHAHRVITAHPFALLITAHASTTHLTWIPVLLDATAGPLGTLEGHVARINPHAEALVAGAPSVVAFLGPHGYVSPRWYTDPDAQVPTWNYVAVHAHGRPRAIVDPEALAGVVARLSAAFESGRPSPWSVDEARAHSARLLPHIVGFRLEVERFEQQRKLSQNKGDADRAGVLAALGASAAPGDAALRAAMLELYREDGRAR